MKQDYAVSEGRITYTKGYGDAFTAAEVKKIVENIAPKSENFVVTGKSRLKKNRTLVVRFEYGPVAGNFPSTIMRIADDGLWRAGADLYFRIRYSVPAHHFKRTVVLKRDRKPKTFVGAISS